MFICDIFVDVILRVFFFSFVHHISGFVASLAILYSASVCPRYRSRDMHNAELVRKTILDCNLVSISEYSQYVAIWIGSMVEVCR